MIDISLYAYMREMLAQTPVAFHRYMYHRIDWNSRMVGIMGPRGVGKSTMVLQYIRQHQAEGMHLYVSADHIYFSNHNLVDLADDFVKEGGTHLYLDEVHKYKGWSRELKQIYDVHPTLHVVFTGSSILDIQKGEADLSRRALMYQMQGLSFREYLALYKSIHSEPFTLEDILSNKIDLPELPHPLPVFREYLSRGYYPFVGEGGLEMRMNQIISQTIETDIAQYADKNATTARQ